MQFRFCCTCEDDKTSKSVESTENTARSNEPRNSVPQTISTPPKVITQQPKHVVEPIQLDRITEVSVEESSVQALEEAHPLPAPPTRQPLRQALSPIQDQAIQNPSIQEPNTIAIIEENDTPKPSSQKVEELYDRFFNLLQTERANEQSNPQPVAQLPNITAETMIGNEKLFLAQVAPDLYRCNFKRSVFYILEGNIYDTNSILDESDKEAIKVVYKRIMEGMKLGARELAGGVNALKGQEVWNPPAGSSINTDYVTRSGEKTKMTFRAIGKGHFRSTYEGKEFTILNGQLVENDGRFDVQDIELIMQTYRNTISGMQEGLRNMEQGMRSVQGEAVRSVPVEGSTAEYGSTTRGEALTQAGTLATGCETLKRMRSLNQGKRISLLDGVLMNEPQKQVVDITAEISKIPKYFDDVDGGKLAEPVLQKTTFTPQAITYDDPKTYEEQDKNELPSVKPQDEYIISMDENFNSENRYHFHQARPRRVVRAKLNPKEKFRLASPERYTLFEEKCLRLHNQYRKMHGVPPLVHNEFLAQVAKEWAEHLALKDAFYHRPDNEYGENLYYTEGMSCSAKMAVKSWYDEIDLYDYNNPKFSREVGHFTQLVWKDTREVGTGVAQIGNKVWVCCNYHPPGNHLDKMNDEFVPRLLMKRYK
ncbi:uncharacterized protein LOC129952215 [Eupeodes corollae]|uniref:uncharacterized protein LOC129952215 n=1 Tax=Eupeodes corollae TaxID=290404 RepID=UPI00248FFEF8|nr:uncharacterized protein LOC129952215 [Eupeodes corollae]